VVGSQLQALVDLLRKRDPVHIVQKAGWAPEPVWTGLKNLPPRGFDPRILQPIASFCTDWATPSFCTDWATSSFCTDWATSAHLCQYLKKSKLVKTNQ
jgi:hypothetical protein